MRPLQSIVMAVLLLMAGAVYVLQAGHALKRDQPKVQAAMASEASETSRTLNGSRWPALTRKLPFSASQVRQSICPASLLALVPEVRRQVTADGAFLRQPVIQLGNQGFGDELRDLLEGMLWSLALGRPLACKPDLVFVHPRSGHGVRAAVLNCAENMKLFSHQQADPSTRRSVEPISQIDDPTLTAPLAENPDMALNLTVAHGHWLNKPTAVTAWLFARIGLQFEPTNVHVIDDLILCLYYVFFEPTPAMEHFLHNTYDMAETSPQRRDMVWFNPRKLVVLAGQRPDFIITVHVRFGGQWWDPVRATATNVSEVLLPCAWNTSLAALASLVHPPLQEGPTVISWHLASDNLTMLRDLTRTFLAKQAAADMPDALIQARWLSSGHVVHYVRSKSHEKDDDGVARLWEDLYFMAMAHSYVLVESGFPRAANTISVRGRGSQQRRTMKVAQGKASYELRKRPDPLVCPRIPQRRGSKRA